MTNGAKRGYEPIFIPSDVIGEQGLGTFAHMVCSLGDVLGVGKEGGGACKGLFNKVLDYCLEWNSLVACPLHRYC